MLRTCGGREEEHLSCVLFYGLVFIEILTERFTRTDTMAEKRQDSGFTVTDRRLFTGDGELRSEVREEKEAPKPAIPPATAPVATETNSQATKSVTPFPAQEDASARQTVPPAPTPA